MCDEVVVVAFDKYSKMSKVVSSCYKKDAQKYARYYRSIGYNVRVMDYDGLDELIEKERKERYQRMF